MHECENQNSFQKKMVENSDSTILMESLSWNDMLMSSTAFLCLRLAWSNLPESSVEKWLGLVQSCFHFNHNKAPLGPILATCPRKATSRLQPITVLCTKPRPWAEETRSSRKQEQSHARSQGPPPYRKSHGRSSLGRPLIPRLKHLRVLQSPLVSPLSTSIPRGLH